MIAGSLTYNTEMDTKGYQKGINDITGKTKSAGASIKSIVAGLGITKLISKAISMIVSNIDGAVKRIDTLNNFPKVMSNLGIGAEESSEAIKQLSDNLKGLPTTLNEGAMAVQRFTSKNGNVKKSVELFTAVNNAILAGGASADIQSTALEQLSQAYAKGKPDMMEWRSLMTAMPAQLKQVAQAMGYVSTDALGEALRNGTVSMDEFMDTIIKLNKNGTGEFKSFEEQAKNSTDGIGTAVKNMETSVTRGIADIVQSIDDSLKEAGLGGISGVISKMGEVAESGLKTVANNIRKIDWKLVREAVMSMIPVEDIQNSIARLREQILPLVEKFRNKLKETWENIQPTIQKIRDAIIEAWEKIQPKIEPLIDSFSRLMEALEPVAEYVLEVMQPIFDEWGDELIELIGLLADIIGFIIDVSTAWNDALAGVINFFSGIGNTIDSFKKNAENSINTVIDVFNNLPYYIGVAIGNIISKIDEFKNNIINFATVTIPNFINSIIEWFKTLPDRIREQFNNALNKVKEWINNMRNVITVEIPKIVNNIIDFFRNLPDNMRNIGANILQGLWNGILSGKDWILNKINSLTSDIVRGMKDSLGIHSPSTIFRDQVGKFIPQGVAVGIQLDTNKAINAIDEMNKKIVSRMNNAVNIETGKMNATANIKANSSFDSVIVLNASFDGNVELDNTRVGRIIAPDVARTIKAGGLA